MQPSRREGGSVWERPTSSVDKGRSNKAARASKAGSSLVEAASLSRGPAERMCRPIARNLARRCSALLPTRWNTGPSSGSAKICFHFPIPCRRMPTSKARTSASDQRVPAVLTKEGKESARLPTTAEDATGAAVTESTDVASTTRGASSLFSSGRARACAVATTGVSRLSPSVVRGRLRDTSRNACLAAAAEEAVVLEEVGAGDVCLRGSAR